MTVSLATKKLYRNSKNSNKPNTPRRKSNTQRDKSNTRRRKAKTRNGNPSTKKKINMTGGDGLYDGLIKLIKNNAPHIEFIKLALKNRRQLPEKITYSPGTYIKNDNGTKKILSYEGYGVSKAELLKVINNPDTVFNSYKDQQYTPLEESEKKKYKEAINKLYEGKDEGDEISAAELSGKLLYVLENNSDTPDPVVKFLSKKHHDMNEINNISQKMELVPPNTVYLPKELFEFKYSELVDYYKNKIPLDTYLHNKYIRYTRNSDKTLTELLTNITPDFNYGSLFSKMVLTLPKTENKLNLFINDFKSLESLSISADNIEHIPVEIYSLTKLKTLSISGNNIKTIPPNIGDLQSLVSLSINSKFVLTPGPYIKFNMPSEIYGLTKLETLSIDAYNLDFIDTDIRKLINLENLNCVVHRIPPEIYDLTKLKTLSINVSIPSIPPGIRNLQSLVSLSIHGKNLTSIPPEIGDLQSLVSLSIHGERLTSIPPEIGDLQSLVSLSIHGERLTFIPPEIYGLTKLKTLSINARILTSIPPQIDELTNLESLSIESISLSSIPQQIGGLNNLKSLSIKSGPLSSIPQQIDGLTNLESLSIESISLSSIPPQIGGLTNLKSLRIASSSLSSISPEIRELTNLESLSIESSSFISIPPQIGDLTELKKLHIKNDYRLRGIIIPKQIGNLTNLEDLSIKYINGRIPREILDLEESIEKFEIEKLT